MATAKRTPKATRATARGIRVSREVAERTKNVQRAIHALGDVLSGNPATVEALTDFAGQVGVLDTKLDGSKLTVREALVAIQATVGDAATAKLTAIVSGAGSSSYANEARAKEIGQTKPVPVTAK